MRFRFLTLPVVVFTALRCLVHAQGADPQSISGTRFDIDINGRIIVVDAEKNVIRLYSKDMVLVKEVGGPGWGDGQFDRPAGVWARNGIDIFVADYGNHRIQRFDRNLVFVSSFYTRDSQNPDERFGYPKDIGVSRLGDLFICDGENSRVLKVAGISNSVEKTFGGFDAGKGRLHSPDQLEVGYNDNVYVQDGLRIVEFDNFGNFIRSIGDGLFKDRVLISTDVYGLTVLDGTRLFFFDKDDRLVLDMELSALLKGEQGEVRAFSFSRGNGYFLTSGGLISAADPRIAETEKNQK